ncbi:MAG: hypothetical protein OEV64_09650 [Desulfobulbaceae bacterium]|nr:hypothetical protein [Desulfobulbaceae bacterium]
MDKEAAEKLSILLMQINAKLDQSIAFVRDNDTEENYHEYRQVVGKIMGSLYLDIEEKLWMQYPELRPKKMNGPYELPENIFEPIFYTRNEEST